MRLPSWLRALSARLNPAHTGRIPQRPSFRPRVEALEERTTPTATLANFQGAPNLVQIGSWAYFGNDGTQLWRTDGTAAHTTQVDSGSHFVFLNDGLEGNRSGLVAAGQYLYFVTDNTDTPDGQTIPAEGTSTLWRNDSQTGISQQLYTFANGPDATTVYDLTAVGQDVYFGAYAGSAYGYELWKCDGATETTALFRDTWAGPDSGYPGSLTAAGPYLYYRGGPDGGLYSLNRSDLANPIPTPTLDFGDGFRSVVIGSDVYFLGEDSSGLGLWTVQGDASTPTAQLVKPLIQNNFSSRGENTLDGITLATANGMLYFTTATDSTGLDNSYQLWECQGTTATQIGSFSGGTVYENHYSPLQIAVQTTETGTEIYLSDFDQTLNDGPDGRLWKIDQATGNATLLHTFEALSFDGGYISSLTVVGSNVYFGAPASSTSSRYELWQSSGTVDGTHTVDDALPDLFFLPYLGYSWLSDVLDFPSSIGFFGSSVYFSAGGQLWRINNPPVANADAYAGQQDTPLTVAAAAGVLANDTDVDPGDLANLTASLVSVPAHGSLTFNPDGSYTYTPDAGYVGPDSFTYQASDGVDPSNVATVTLNIQNLFTADGLQSALSSLPPNGTVTIQATPDTSAAVAAAIEGVTVPQAQSVSVYVNLATGTYTPTDIQVPAGMTLYINGVPGTVIDPDSPAFTLVSGNVVISNVTFVTTGAAPTILVTGGSLTLRNDVIQESTGFSQAAISATGGTVDLGTESDPGGNTLVVNGPGVFVSNVGPNSVSQVGDTYVIVKQSSTTTATGGTFTYDGNPHAGSGLVNVAGGVVTLSYVGINGTTYSSTTAPTNAGTYTVTATYAGDDYHIGSSDYATITIQPKLLDVSAWSQGTINIGSNGQIVLHLAVDSGQLYGTDSVFNLFNGAIFTVAIQNADGSTTYGTLASVAHVETDGSITVSMQMDDTLRADLYDAYVHGRAVNFNMTATANGGNYSIDEDTMSKLLNNGALRYVL